MFYCIAIPTAILLLNILILYFMIRNVEIKEQKNKIEDDNV